MPQTPMTPQDKVGAVQDFVPVYGRAGHGAASIVPHLCRQQRINDKPVSEERAAELHRPGGESKPGA